jgi:hypothetical protein
VFERILGIVQPVFLVIVLLGNLASLVFVPLALASRCN